MKNSAAPACNVNRARFEILVKELVNSDVDQAEGMLAQFIRETSLTVPEVGPHSLSILLDPPDIAQARVRYLPTGSPAIASVTSAQGGTFIVPAAFTPWLVGPNTILARSINSGSLQVHLGHYTISLETPELRDPGILGLLSSQQRPKQP